jgi:2-oxoisovalerate dehydrogenase E1 component
MDATALLELHRRMLLIRGFEERISACYRDGEVPGFVHLSIGQEAAAVGACWGLAPLDVITSTHRGHGHCLAKGMAPLDMFAELLARDAGSNRGRGGSMHVADPRLGVFGANGIVAAGLPIAVGAATAAQLRADGIDPHSPSGVAVAFFGDGAVAQGAFHEAVNLAAVWRSPVVFFCENNGYAEFSPASTQHAGTLAQRAIGYGVRHVAVDGYDVVAVVDTMDEVLASVRAGGGPVIVEAATYRWHGHYEGDPQRYRTTDEVEEWAAYDPLVVHAARMRDAGVADELVAALTENVRAELDLALATARALPAPDPSTLHHYVVRERPRIDEPAPVAADAPVFRTMDAVRTALEIEL